VEKENQWYDSKGDTLVLMLYSMTNQPLLHNDGEIATFQLRLNGNSGGYGLYPQDVVLSNITEENMVSATYEGWVNIQSPSLYGSDNLQFGNCPVTETSIATYSFNNYGDAPLQIERVTFLAEGYRVVTPLPLVVNPWEEGSLQIAYDPNSEGDFSTTMNLYTNDPTNRLKTVTISGHVYEPNSLTLTGQSNQDGTYTLSVAMENYTDIVAVQYDVHWHSDMTTSQAAFKPSDRMSSHSYSVTPLGDNGYRIILFSFSNALISGHDGLLNQLVFTPQGDVNYCGSTIYVDNIVLSNAAGSDKTSVPTTSLHTAHTKWENVAATACDEYMWNGTTYTETGIYIDTIPSLSGCDSIVTLHLTINRSITTEETYVSCDSYTWNGETYSENGEYVYTTVAANGCDSIVTLHLTILPDATTESETLALCPSELPYEWYGQLLTEEGTYSATEPYAGMECDSVIHQLNLQIYVQTLPLAVTPPVVYAGKKIDVSVPTEEILAFINAETLYAPQSTITWYVKNNTEWQLLTDEIINFESSQIELKYVVETDCGNQESTSISITILTTNLEEAISQESVVNIIVLF
jgi:hypothetical protein